MGLEIPQLNSCCCGCTLKTGTKIIGWLQLIGSIVLVITLALSVAALSTIEEDPSQIPDSPAKKQLLDIIPVMKVLIYILITVSLISCVFGVVLLMGVYQNNAKLVFVWIVATLTTTVLSVLINIGQFSFAHQSNVFSNIITFLINIYFLLVVYSYYREIKNVSSNA